MTFASLLAALALYACHRMLRPPRTWEVRAGGMRVRAGLTRLAAAGQVAALAHLPDVLAVDRTSGEVL